MTSFNFKDAFDIQNRNVADWAKVLQTDAYLLVIRKVIERNDKGYDSPYDVWRGQDIDNIVKDIIISI